MLFDLSDLDPRGVELDRVVAVPPFAYEGDDVECGPVRLVGTLRPTRRGIEFAAEFETVAKLRCSRCLAPVELSLGERFRLFLVPPPAEAEDEAGRVAHRGPRRRDMAEYRSVTITASRRFNLSEAPVRPPAP